MRRLRISKGTRSSGRSIARPVAPMFGLRGGGASKNKYNFTIKSFVSTMLLPRKCRCRPMYFLTLRCTNAWVKQRFSNLREGVALANTWASKWIDVWSPTLLIGTSPAASETNLYGSSACTSGTRTQTNRAARRSTRQIELLDVVAPPIL